MWQNLGPEWAPVTSLAVFMLAKVGVGWLLTKFLRWR